jgi:hypothetical protein
MSVITKDQNGVDHEILTLKEWEVKQGTPAQSVEDFSGYLNYSTGALTKAGQDPDESYRTVSQNLFGTAIKRGFVQAPEQDDPELDKKLNESFRTFSDQVTQSTSPDYGVLASYLSRTNPEASQAFQSYYEQAKEAKRANQTVLQTPEEEVKFNELKAQFANPDQVRDARILAAKEKGLSYVEYMANDKGDRGVWINPDPAVAKDANSILDSYERSDGLNSPVTLKFAQKQVQKNPGRNTSPYEDTQHAELQQFITGAQARAESPDLNVSGFALEILDSLKAATEFQQEAYKQGASIDEASRKEVTEVRGYEYQNMGFGAVPVAKTFNTGKIAEAKLSSLYDRLKQAEPDNEIFAQYTKQQFVNAAGDLVKQSLQVPVNNEDPTKNFVKLSDGTYTPLESTSVLTKEKFVEAMNKLGMDDRAKAAAEITRKGYLAQGADAINDAFEEFDGERYNKFRMEWLDSRTPAQSSSQADLLEDYMAEASKRKDWNVLAVKTTGILGSVVKSFNPIVFAVGGGVSNLVGFETGKDFFLDMALADAELEARRAKYANLYGSELGTGYQFLAQAAPMVADIAISGGVSTVSKGLARVALRETLQAGAEAGATALTRDLIPSSVKGFAGKAIQNVVPTSVNEFAGNIGKNWIAKALSPETRAIFGQSYIRQFGEVGAVAVKADSALVNKVFRGIKADLANHVIPIAAGTVTQRATSFARSAESQYVDTTMGMRAELNADGSRKFTDEQIHKSALTHSLVAGSITALIEQASTKVFGQGADLVSYGHVNLRQLKFYTSRVSSALERSSLGGQEVLGAIKSVVKEAAKESGYGIVKEGTGEFIEEFSDTLAQAVANSMLDNKELNLADALKDALQSGVIGFGYGTAVPALNNARRINQAQDREQGIAQSVEGTFLSNVITKLESDGQSPETVAILKNRLKLANRNFQPVSERIPVSANLVTALDQVPEQPIVFSPRAVSSAPSGSVPTRLAAQKAAELKITPQELKSIQGSGKLNKQNKTTITPNDVQTYVAQRAAQLAQDSDIDWDNQAQVEAYLTRNGVKFVSEGAGESPTVDETRTFKDLKGQLVVINGTRGRIRVEADGVLLDPETNEPPIEVTPNADMPAVEFEGFEGAVAEPSLVSPRRNVRRVALTVSDSGQIVYGKTRYDAPTTPSLVNVKVADNGDIDSMYVLVQNKNGKAVYAYVTGENAQKLRQVYEGRGQESADAFAKAVASSKSADVQRNQAAANAKQNQSTQRRKNKRAKNGAPLVSSQGQAAVEAQANYALSLITGRNVNPKLVEELRSVATQLGLDPDTFATTEELFRIVGPELAAGLDLGTFTQAQLNKAVQNVQQGRTNTLLDFLVQQEAISPAGRAAQANHFAKLRAQHRVQFAKHGIKEGQMDVKTVLQSVVRSGKSKMHRETAKFLLSVGVEKCPVFVYNSPNDVGTTGGYLGASKIITLNAASDNGGGVVDALLHELTHFATAEVINNPKNDFERQVRARLLALRAEAQTKIEARYGNAIPENLRYAVEGRMNENEAYNEEYAVNEFVAHYFASQTFRLQLDGLAEKGERSMYQKFLDVLASFFSGKRLADPESRALAEAMLDLKKAVAEGNGLPARSVQQILASKAAVARQDGFGPMFGVPNPHARASFDWINHQTDSLQDGIFSEAQLRTLIKTGKFGAFTAENPDATVTTEEANAEFNERAKQWMEQRGYVADIVVGRYGNGENSFLVDGFTDQDAVDFANEFGQESMATDSGLFYQDGMYQPRDGEELDIPADEASDDNYFTNVRTTEGKIITVRVMYKDDKVDSGLRYSKDLVTDTGSENLIVKQVQNQKEFATVISKDTSKPFVLDGNTLVVNEDLVNEVYGAYAFEEQSSLVERDLAVAVAHELAMQRVGEETRVAFEDSGLNAAQVIERAASNDLTASDLQDLLGLGERATDYVAATFAEIGLRNDGQNERLAVTQNRLGDLFRYLQRKGEDIPQDAQSFSGTVSDTDLAIAERLRPVVPTNYFSKAYTGFNAEDLKPGQALGTRNPTGKSATESGLDPMSLIGLDVMARDPKGYRTNALYLTEYPIVAREFPKLAKLVRGLRTEHEKTGSKIRVNADQIKRYKKALKDLLTVEKVKATDAQFEDALLLEKGGLAGQAGKDFAKKQAALEKCLAKSKELKALKTKQKSEMTKTLAGFATDPEHPIATLAPKIYNVVIQNTQSNLEALINLFPKNLRNVAKLWYDGANKIANEFGVAYAQDVEQASGVLAVFSPQKDWFMNIALAERTLKIWHQQVILGNPNAIVWGPEMTAQWLKRGGEPQITTEATDSSLPIYEKGKVKAVYDSNGEHVFDEQGNPMFTGWSSANAEAGRNKAREILKQLEGRALKDLAIENQARFIRMYSEVNDAPAFMKYAPDGTNTKQASRSETSGKETRLAWGSYSTVQKAIRIMSSDKATKLKVVSKELGNMHKVRSFYNNIVDPNNEDGHVTMDTHAVAALYWQALSGNSFEVSQNFGSSNVTNNSILGVNGLYAANAEAYRAAALTFGLLPREIQSITWEAVRLLFTAKWKSNKKNVDAVRAVWARYEKDKKFTIEDARAAVYQLATGKDINEAFANTEHVLKGLGFPSWAEVELRKGQAGEVPLEQAAPTIQRSRAAVARHTELEAKYNAGTIIESEKKEAENTVNQMARKAGFTKELWHGSSDSTWNQANLAFDSGYAPYSLGLQLSSSTKVASKFGEVRKFFVNVGKTLDTTEGSPKEYNVEIIVNKLKNVSPQDLIDQNGFETLEEAAQSLLDTINSLQELDSKASGQEVLDAMTAGYPHERGRLLRASGFDTIVHTSTDSMGGQLGGSSKATTYGILNPSQIKSADPFTGSPLDQRFNEATPDIRFSRATTKEGILKQLSIPKVAVNPPSGKPLYVTGYHGGTFDGRTPMKASSEGVYGYGYYTTPDATRSVDYAKEARKEKGQAEVTTFDVLFMKPLVVKVSKVEFGPALVFEALGLPKEKALSKTVHLFEQYGNIGKHFKSLGEKQGYDGLVILKSDGTISESVAWTRDSLTVDDNAPTIQFSRAALAPTTEQESKAFASANKNKRSGELAVAAVRLAEGQMDNETFADLVEILDPWVVKGAQAIPPIEQVKKYIVARREGKVLSADEEEKIGKVMEDLDIPEGQVVDWRIDIPTYNRSLEAGEVTYTITGHPLNNVKKVIGYTNIARVRNGRVMTRVEKGNPMTIAQGGAKFPLATVQGEHVKIDRLPADINDPEVWAETAYNPARSSEFVDVRTKLPVLTFDDAILVGSRVFMKNPTYDSKPRYQQPRVNLAAEPTGQTDLRYSRASTEAYLNSEYRKTWSDAARKFLGARVHPSEIPVVLDRYMRISDMPESLRDLATVGYVSKKLQQETDMAGNDVFDIITTPVETDTAWNDLDSAFRNSLRTKFEQRAQALERIKVQTKGLYTDSEIITYAMNLPTVSDIEAQDNWITVKLEKGGIQQSRSAAPARFRGKEVQLTHWSFDSDLENTDPNMHGTGGIGSEKDRKRDYKKIYQPRTYFGYSSYVREHVIGQFRYQIKVAGDSLYDYDADPLDLFPSRDERVALGYARFDDRAATTLYEKTIKDKGFAGYVSKTHTAGVLFGRHKVTKVPDSDRSLALNPKPKAPKILLSRALTAVTSPDIESSYRVSLDDLAINEVTGEYNFGNKLTRLLRASGNLDPRMYEAKQYQERAMNLANKRVAGLTKTFLGALKKENTVDLDDVNVALGTTAPTVSQADRAAARTTRDAELEAINVQYQQTDQAYARYKQGTVKARADYATHQDVKLYQREVSTLQAELANSPEKQTRTAAITAANAAYALDIQAARAKGVKTAMVAQQQALFRLEQNNPRVAEVVTEFRSAIDSLSQQLVESLGPNDPMRAVVTENLGVYLTRTYQIHHDEGYVEKIKNDPTFAQARQEARDFFEKAWVKRTFQSWRSNDLYAVFSDAEVQALVEAEARAQSIGSIELDNFIEQHGETPEIPGKILNKTDLTRFMEKGEVPRELVAILGEIQNPVENAMRTYSNLSTFVGTQRLLNQFAQVGLDNGFLVTAEQKAKDPEKYRLYEPLLNSTKTLGGEPLSNYYAPPEVKEAFKISFSPDRKAPKSDAAQFIYQIELLTAQAIGKSLSMLTLGSAGFYTRNMVSNVLYMGANGFIASPANIADSIKGLNEIYGTNFLNRAAQMLPEFARPDEKFSLSELGPLGSDLIALGLNDSINGGVLKDLFYGMSGDPVNFLAKLEETIRSKGKVASATLTAVKAPYQAVSSAFDTFASAAEAIDLMYKFAYYSHEVKVLTEANAYNTTKWTETQIKQLAARTVRKTTQGRSEVAAVAKAFQASPLATLMNSYFRFTAETVRLPFAITSIGMKEFNSGNPVLRARGKKRLAGFGVVLALSAVPEILKMIGSGFEDDKEQAIRNSLPAWAKDVNYFFDTDPQDLSKIKMWNLTYVHPFALIADPFMRSAHLMRSGRADETPAVLLGAIADAFFSPQIAVEAIAKARNNTNDQGGKIWYENDSTPMAAFKIFKFMANSAYRLKSPQKFLQAFEAYTNNSIYDQDARLATALELVTDEFNPFQTRKYDLVKLAHQAFGKIKRDQDAVTAERGKFKTEAPLSSQQVEDVYVSLEDARLYAARKLQKTVSGFKKLGVSDQELKRQANDVGISKDRYNQIINRNVVDRVVFEKDMFSEMLERGGEANGQARVDYLKQAIQKRPRFIPVNP